MHAPREKHWRGTLLILMHVKRAPDKDLLYMGHDHFWIHAFSDSGHIGVALADILLIASALMLVGT